jgi:hypothetical protein
MDNFFVVSDDVGLTNIHVYTAGECPGLRLGSILIP